MNLDPYYMLVMIISFYFITLRRKMSCQFVGHFLKSHRSTKMFYRHCGRGPFLKKSTFMPFQKETEETWFRSLGREDPLEEGMATHSSILAWRIPQAEEPGSLQSITMQTVGHDSSDLAKKTPKLIFKY